MGSMSTTMRQADDLLLTAEEVALMLKVSKDWVWDHSSRRLPYLSVIRMSDGVQIQLVQSLGQSTER